MSQQEGWVYCIAIANNADNIEYKCGCIVEKDIEDKVIETLRQRYETRYPNLQIVFLKKVYNPKRAEGKLRRLILYCDKGKRIVTTDFENIKGILDSVCLEFDPSALFPGKNLKRLLNSRVLVEVDYPQLKLKHTTRIWQ